MKDHTVLVLVFVPLLLAQLWVFERVFATFSGASLWWWPLPKAVAYGALILQAMTLFLFWVCRDVQEASSDG